MQDPQTATLYFFGPVAAAYLYACAGWLVHDHLRGMAASEPPLRPTSRPRLDFALTVLAAVGVFALGEVYRRHWLLPTGSHWFGRCGWTVDNLIIFSPLALVMFARRQGPDTVFLSRARLWEKIALGLVLGVTALSLYSALRGETKLITARLTSSLDPDKLVDFLPVFLEGVALAFAFVRFRWLVGTAAAIAVPAILFAAAHVPGEIAEQRTAAHMAAFFVFNSVLASVVLATVARSRDVIWLGLVHYLLDVAIEAV